LILELVTPISNYIFPQPKEIKVDEKKNEFWEGVLVADQELNRMASQREKESQMIYQKYKMNLMNKFA
jgi:hypothetical protein